MKKVLFSLLPALLLASGLRTIDPLPLGAPIPNPELKMTDISGKVVLLAEAKTSKGLLVMFSCNICPYVIKNQARIYEACKYA